LAISLGNIVVNLTASTAGFIEGMSKASYSAAKSAREIKGSFADMGGAAQSLLSPFGEIGAQMGAAFSGIGATLGTVQKALVGLAGGASVAAVGIGAAVGAVAALGVAGAGIALFAAKGANALFEMSEKTGVSVESLSRLGYAAKQTGVDQESLTKALERMNKSAFAAATAPEGAKNAYTRLGISVKDASGQLKPTSELFEEVAAKIAGIENPTARGAAAMNVFGKSGAELLPLLNQGSDGIAKMAKEADELGVTLSGKTAADSHKFEQTLDTIESALTGASNAVLKEFLPSLQAFASFILNDLKDPSGIFRQIGQVVLNIAVPAFKVLASAIEVAVTAGDYFVTALTEGVKFATQLVLGLGSAITDVAHGHFKEAGDGLKEQFKQGLAAFTKGVTDETEKANKRLQDAFASTWFGQDNGAAPEKKKRNVTDVDTAPADKSNIIADRIAKLAAEVEAEKKFSSAVSDSTAATIAWTAAATAQKTVDDLNVEGKKKGIQVSAEQAASIYKLTLALASYKEALNVNKELEATIQKTEQATRAINAEATAYLQGADAVERAEESAKVAPFAKIVADLSQLIQKNKEAGESASELAALNQRYDEAKQRLDAVTAAIHAEAQAQESLNFSKVSADLTIQIQKLSQYSSAILGGAAAVRQFNLEQQVAAFARQNPLLSTDQLNAYREQLQQVGDEEQKNAAAEQIAAQLSFKNLQDKIAQLELLRDTFKAGSDEQIAADAVLRKDQIEFARGQADLLLSTQSLGNGFKAFFIDFSNNAKTVAQDVSATMSKLFSGIEDNLAKLVTGQKTSWHKMITGIGEEVAKMGIDTALKGATGGIGNLLGINLGGASGQKPGTSKGNALWVRNADGVAGLGAAGASGSLDNIFGKMWPGAAKSTSLGGTPDGSQQNPTYITTADTPGTGILAGLGGAAKGIGGAIGGMFGGAGKGIGSGLGSLLSLIPGFGGMFADGGDVTPGRSYLVGERGPEMIMPRAASTVVPNHALSTGNGKVVNLGGVHFHGVTSHDEFKKSKDQIMRDFSRQTQVAMSR
jgi:phage-related minor tail protein